MNRHYRFGRYQIQPAAQRLLVDGEITAVGPRAFDVLVALVERAGQLVSKAELLDLVWPGLVVEENNLQVQVSTLRKILGADAIVTVTGRGYRFALPLETEDSPRNDPSAGPSDLPGKAAGLPSIAVLPFVNISDDAANEYFADGLSEELINVLSKITGLRVVSRTSAFSFKDAKTDIQTVASKLNVATILEGSVRRADTRVRITAQLIHVATDSHLWSETYDRELEDIFAVQDDIAHAVVKEMRAALMSGPAQATGSALLRAEVQAAVTGRSSLPEAYRLYLQGNFFFKRYNADDMAKAVGYFQRALELDPQYAMAWASLSACYLYQSASAWAPISEGAQRAREAAQRALETGPEVAASHWAMATVLLYHDWDWPRAEAAIRRALELAPEDSQLCVRAVNLMQSLDRLEEAAALARRALALDPLNVDAHIAYGWQLAIEGQLVDAETSFRNALELSPQYARIHANLGRILGLQGRLDEALCEFNLEPSETFRLHGIALVQHARGRAVESEAALEELAIKFAEDSAYQIAEVYAFRKQADQAFEWLERAYRQRDAGLVSMRNAIWLRNLHSDPRWQPFIARMSL